MGTKIKSFRSDLGAKIFKEYWNLGMSGVQNFGCGVISTVTSLVGLGGIYLAIAHSQDPFSDNAPYLISWLLFVGLGSGIVTKVLGNSTFKKYKKLKQKFEGENLLNYFGKDLEERGQRIEFYDSKNDLEKKISITPPAVDILLMNGLEEIKTKDKEYSSFKSKSHLYSLQSIFSDMKDDEKKEICYRILKPYTLLNKKDWEDYHRIVKSKITDSSFSILKLVGIVDDIYDFLEEKNEVDRYSKIFEDICRKHKFREENTYGKNISPR